MLGELSGVAKIFIITGRTDMRKSFDGLMAIIRDTYQLDPYANALYHVQYLFPCTGSEQATDSRLRHCR